MLQGKRITKISTNYKDAAIESRVRSRPARGTLGTLLSAAPASDVGKRSATRGCVQRAAQKDTPLRHTVKVHIGNAQHVKAIQCDGSGKAPRKKLKKHTRKHSISFRKQAITNSMKAYKKHPIKHSTKLQEKTIKIDGIFQSIKPKKLNQIDMLRKFVMEPFKAYLLAAMQFDACCGGL